MIRTWKGRGLVLVAVAPLLGVVPTAAVARADHSGPPPRPRTHAAPSKPKAQPKSKTKTKTKPKTKHAKHAKPKSKADAKPKAVKAKKDEAHVQHVRAVQLQMGAPKQDVVPGRTYEWTYRVVANGPARSGKAVFRTTLPKPLAFVSGERNCTSSRERRVVCRLGTIGRGQEIAGSIRARVSKRAQPDLRISPRGVVSWAGTRVTRRFPAVRVAPTADLALSQSAPSRSRAGAAIPYAMKVRNLGPGTATNVTVWSAGPVKIVGRDTACMPYGRGNLCSIGTLKPGRSRTVHVKAVPRRDVRAGTVLESSWRASSPTADPDPANNAMAVRTRITGRR
ncbi:DUF11 domain-containing protein [Actinomadura syzygii]|uniref:DUF11 domain-containing protein n=1 Tax=Actinomadura syzygii TaxID=1427538 RepID=A0A5D0U393_9ACTN|nr:DUF11 domain-containing protein [Actinomadura syzygii]TYC12547.1 hypothetical protein FXF65_25320 [Actinomadura syzygii]